jgi:hypothetical protein
MPNGQTEAAHTRRRLVPEDAKRLSGLVKLKNYAIQHSLEMGDETIQGINDLDFSYIHDVPLETERLSPAAEPIAMDEVGRMSEKDLVRLDQLAVALTKITYPITIENVGRISNTTNLTRFASVVLWFGILSALLCGLFMGIIKFANTKSLSIEVLVAEASKVSLALLLGTVGAILYVILLNGKLNIVAGLDEESKAMNKLRIQLGALLGFVLFVLMPTMFDDTSSAPYKLLIPLTGGHSATLVVGVLAKAVTAIETALNLDEKNTRAALKRPVS